MALYVYFYPCRLADLVGFGVAIATGMQFIENFPERTYKSMLIPLLQEDKRAGAGFLLKLNGQVVSLLI